MNEQPTTTLSDALERYEIELPADQVGQLERYCRLLWNWNEKLNLTRHTDFDKFVSRDLVDSWELSKLLAPGERVLDVGSGGGVPGVVLAILRPDLQLTLSESVGKKATVLQAIVRELGLPTPVQHTRAEQALGNARYDTLVARAVGPLWKMLQWFQPHWDAIGRLLAVKGPKWIEERGEARHRGLFRGLELRKIASYPLAGTNSESVILQIRPKSPRATSRASVSPN